MEPRPLQVTVEDMRSFIQRKVAGGFDAAEDIESSAVEVFADDQNGSVLRPIAARLTREVVAAHLAAQKEWPAVTDCDLFDRALQELDRAGIVARHNFTCCGT